MPCYTRYEMTEKMTAKNQFILDKILMKLGHDKMKPGERVIRLHDGGTIEVRDGEVIFDRRYAGLVKQLKIEYAREAVSTMAKRLGCDMTAAGKNELLIQKGM